MTHDPDQHRSIGDHPHDAIHVVIRITSTGQPTSPGTALGVGRTDYRLPDAVTDLQASDWLIRYCLPLYLDHIGLQADAARLRSTPPLIDPTARTSDSKQIALTASGLGQLARDWTDTHSPYDGADMLERYVAAMALYTVTYGVTCLWVCAVALGWPIAAAEPLRHLTGIAKHTAEQLLDTWHHSIADIVQVATAAP